jgi:hypothetical protein
MFVLTNFEQSLRQKLVLTILTLLKLWTWAAVFLWQ